MTANSNQDRGNTWGPCLSRQISQQVRTIAFMMRRQPTVRHASYLAPLSRQTTNKRFLMADDYLWVDTEDALQSLCQELRASDWLALDTEFMRERTYYPQFCLAQIATPGVVACVDVLAIKSLEPLFGLLQNPDIVKVLHSARQDLEMFFHLSGRVPAPIFDTQLAASFAGFPDQASYASV